VDAINGVFWGCEGGKSWWNAISRRHQTVNFSLYLFSFLKAVNLLQMLIHNWINFPLEGDAA